MHSIFNAVESRLILTHIKFLLKSESTEFVKIYSIKPIHTYKLFKCNQTQTNNGFVQCCITTTGDE